MPDEIIDLSANAVTGRQPTIQLTDAPRRGRDETLDTRVGAAILQPRVELTPYNPEKPRDYVRLIVTVGLLIMLFVVVVWACIESRSWPNHWDQTKEMLQIVLPALIGLIGSALGFYFGTGTVSKQQT